MSGRPMTCSTRVAEPTGTVDLLTTMAPVLQVGTDLLGRRLDVGQIGRPVVALGRRHAQEDELGADHGLGGRGGEAQMAGVDALGHQLVQPRLDDGHHARCAARPGAPGRARPAPPGARSGPGWPRWAGRRSRRRSPPPRTMPGRWPSCSCAVSRVVPRRHLLGRQGVDQSRPAHPASPARAAGHSGAGPCCRAPSWPGGGPGGAGRARLWRWRAPARDPRRPPPGWPVPSPTRWWSRCWSRGRCPGACRFRASRWRRPGRP